MMLSRGWILSVAGLLCTTSLVLAQAPTPTPVDSNVAVTSYAQSRGQDLSGAQCTTLSGNGCGGCYPSPKNSTDPVQILSIFNPEWAPIGPMIPGVDSSVPPLAEPVLIAGTVALSKSPGDDFPASHISSDYNAELIPDDNSRLGTGDYDTRLGDYARLEFEWEGDKFPLFAWPGENDRMVALGRWIFDCGHPDPSVDGHCSNDMAKACLADGDCSGGTCTAPAPMFNYQAELHPPFASVAIRSKNIGTTPATRADVYISADAGGAGDRCVVTHDASVADTLLNKSCFLNHCSVTTNRSCLVAKDCAKGETCLRFDPANRLANINASNFEFDMPLPPQPPGATKLKIKTKKMLSPKGSIQPKPTLLPTLSPTPNLHVIIPMANALPQGMPNLFAQSITAAWQGDKTRLRHVQVQFTGLTVNNPVKSSTPVVARRCTNALPPFGLSDTPCNVDNDCPKGTCAAAGGPCSTNKQCAPTDYCTNASHCIAGITPGWRVWGEVNGDWVEFSGLSAIGSDSVPFTSPPYPLEIKEKFKFDEYVPATDGKIHIKTSGRSMNCLNAVFGHNLSELLKGFGLTAGASCLLDGNSTDPGTVDITHSAPNFGTMPGIVTPFSVTSSGGNAGVCSITTNQLCISDGDCPTGENCNVTGGGFTLHYTIRVSP